MFAHRLLDLLTFQIRGTGTSYKDDIIRHGTIRIQMRECLSDQSAAAISSDCFADLFRGGYSYPKVIFFSFERIGNESGGYQRLTLMVDTLKIPVIGNRSNLH